MKKLSLLLVFFGFFLVPTLKLEAQQHQSAVHRQNEEPDYFDRFVYWLAGLWSRAGDKKGELKEREKQREALLKQQEAKRAQEELELKNLPPYPDYQGGQLEVDDSELPPPPSQQELAALHGNAGNEVPPLPSEGAHGEVMATELQAALLNKTGKLDDETYGYLKHVLEGLRTDVLAAGDDTLVISVNDGIRATLKAYADGNLTEAALKEYVLNIYEWWYNEFNIAQKYNGDMTPEPVAAALFDNEDDDDWDAYDDEDMEAQIAQEESEKFPPAPPLPSEQLVHDEGYASNEEGDDQQVRNKPSQPKTLDDYLHLRRSALGYGSDD